MFDSIKCGFIDIFRRIYGGVKPKDVEPFYDVETPDLNDRLVADVLSGKLVFTNFKYKHHICTEHHFRSGSRIQLRVDYPDIGGGSYSFAYINGVENKEVDVTRLIYAIDNRKDAGKSKLSLFWM